MDNSNDYCEAIKIWPGCIDSDAHQLQRCHYTNVIGHITVRWASDATIQHTGVSTNSTGNAIDRILIEVLAI